MIFLTFFLSKGKTLKENMLELFLKKVEI